MSARPVGERGTTRNCSTREKGLEGKREVKRLEETSDREPDGTCKRRQVAAWERSFWVDDEMVGGSERKEPMRPESIDERLEEWYGESVFLASRRFCGCTDVGDLKFVIKE